MNKDTNFTDIDELVRIINQQSAFPPQARTLVKLIDKLPYESELLINISCYHYGYIEGKRAERARRKRAA